MLSSKPRTPLKPVTRNVDTHRTIGEIKRNIRNAKQILENPTVKKGNTSKISKVQSAPKISKKKLKVSEMIQQVDLQNDVKTINQEICNQQEFELINSNQYEIDYETLYEIKIQKERTLQIMKRNDTIFKLIVFALTIIYSFTVIAC